MEDLASRIKELPRKGFPEDKLNEEEVAAFRAALPADIL